MKEEIKKLGIPLLVFVILISGCSVNQNMVYHTVQEVDCEEVIQLVKDRAYVNNSGDGELLISLFNKCNLSINVTKLEAGEYSTTENGVIFNNSTTEFRIPVNNLPLTGFNSDLLINYTKNGIRYSTICDFSLSEDNYKSTNNGVKVIDCGEGIDLFHESLNVTESGDGELLLKFYNLFPDVMNVTSLEFNNESYPGGLINDHEYRSFSIPVSGVPINGFEGEVLVNYSNSDDSYSSVCEFKVEEDDYDFFEEVIILPGSEDYELTHDYSNPLNISEINEGPGGCSSLSKCVTHCNESLTTECLDWIHSIYSSLDTGNQVIINGNYDGVWLSSIAAVRDNAKLIPRLKQDGVNTVSFGPDIITRDVEEPVSAGDNVFKFYIKLFEDSGFNVNLVPNAMHWGNNDVGLNELNKVLIEWAGVAEELNTTFFTTFNEVDGHDSNLSETRDWVQEVLPEVKSEYSGSVCVQPTARAFYTGGEGYEIKLDYSGYDCITNFFSALTLEWGWDHNYEERDYLLNEINNVFSEYDSVKYVMPTDVAVYYGRDWAEDSIICSYIENNSTHPNESEGYDLFEFYFEEVYPHTNGSFLNNFKTFTWVNRSANSIVRDYYTNEGGVIDEKWSDILWNTPGLLNLIEDAMISDDDESVIFDWYTYTAGNARLDYEPSVDNPGPFNCTSVDECMNVYKSNPRGYLEISGECFD